jgi:hypothetical protein
MTFEVNKLRIFSSLLLINIMIVIVNLLSFEDSHWFILLIILFFVNWIYISKSLLKYISKIVIDSVSKTFTIEFTNIFSEKNIDIFPISEIKCEFVILTKARGIQSEVFRISHNDSIISTLNLEVDGWNRETCKHIKELIDRSNNLNYTTEK